MPRRTARQTRPQAYDSSLKEMVQQHPEIMVPQLLTGATYIATLDVERIRPTIRVDRVYKIKYHRKEHILHLEFESGANNDMPARLLAYHGILYRDYRLPVISVIIYPFRVVMAKSPLRVRSGRKSLLTFHFQVLPLFELDAQYYVREHITCMYPFLPAMRNVTADLIRQAMQELAEIYGNNEYILSQQFVWMSLLSGRSDTLSQREKREVQEFLNTYDPLWEEHPKVKQINANARAMVKEARREARAEAQRAIQEAQKAQVEAGIEAQRMAEKLAEQRVLQAKRDDLLMIATVRFPSLTQLAQEKVAQIDDPGALSLLIQQIVSAPDEHIARWLLNPPAAQA